MAATEAKNCDWHNSLRQWLLGVFHQQTHLKNQWIPSVKLYTLYVEHMSTFYGVSPDNEEVLGSKKRFSINIKKIDLRINNVKIYSKKYGCHNELHFIAVNANITETDLFSNDVYKLQMRPLRCTKAIQFIKEQKLKLSNLCTINNTKTKSSPSSPIPIFAKVNGVTKSAPGTDHYHSSNHLQQLQIPTNLPPSETEAASDPILFPQNDVSPPMTNNLHHLLSKRAIQYILSSTTLDFTSPDRPDIRSSNFPNIPLRTEKRVNKGMKWHMVATAASLGYHDLPLSAKRVVGKAVTSREAYLGGYKKAPSEYTFRKWWSKYTNSQKPGSKNRVDSVFDSKVGSGRMNFVTYLERRFPKFLHSIYRYATKTIGIDATVPLLLNLMNAKARVDHPLCEIRSTIELTKHHFWTFFNANGGKLKNPTTRPMLTQAQKRMRVKRCKLNKERLKNHEKNNIPFYYCFLDEKWIYTTSRRKKLKILPPAKFENPEEVAIVLPKLQSRRFATKVMYMGIVSPPHDKYYFDGKIFLKRVARPRPQLQNSYNTHFTNSYIINNLIKDGDWTNLLSTNEDMTISELIEQMQQIYGFDDDVAERITFSYHSYPLKRATNKSKTKPVRIGYQTGDKNELLLKNREIWVAVNQEPRPLTLHDIFVQVQVQPGTIVQEDVSCDSEFMLDTVHDIGAAIRSKMYFVSPKVPIYLFMDNAGGHGTDDAKDKYVKILEELYNVIVDWQVPNSPETNMLDLGIWMNLQNIVEKVHKANNTGTSDPDDLDESVMKAWNVFGGTLKMREVANRWKLVLDLIIADNGGNDKVESCRGLKRPLRFTKEDASKYDQYLVYDDEEASCSDMSISDDED